MADQELDNLVLRIDANLTQYENKLRRMNQTTRRSTRGVEVHFRRMTNNVDRMGTMFAARFTGAIAAVAAPAVLARASMATLQYAQDLESASDRIGFSIEQLQEYRFAADQNGIATRALDMGLQRFSRRVAEANQGTGELLGTLQQYGIELRNVDGSMRDINDIFRDYANAIEGADNQSEALRLAFKAFDSEGAALVEFLRGGSGALDDFAAAAREAGVVLEEDLVRQGAEAQRTIDRMRQSIGAQFNRAVLENAEELQQLAEALGNVALAAVRAGAALARMMNLGRGQAGRDPEEAASNLEAVASDLVFRATGARTGDIRNEERRIRSAIGNEAGQELNTELRAAIRSAGDNLTERREVFLEFADRLRQEAQTIRDDAAALAAIEALGQGSGSGSGDGVGGSSNLVDQAAEDAKEAERRARADTYSERKRDRLEMAEAEAERKRELELQIAQDAADAYLQATEENREKFVRVFSDIATDGIRAAFDGDLPEYAARRMQEAFYERLGRLFDQLAETIFNAATGGSKTNTGGNFLSTLVSGARVLFGGGRAVGGNVNPGNAYRVGESGPEMFIPGARGAIVPNQAPMGGVRGGFNQEVRIINAASGVVEVQQKQISEREIEMMIVQRAPRAVAGALDDKNSEVSRALRGNFGVQPNRGNVA